MFHTNTWRVTALCVSALASWLYRLELGQRYRTFKVLLDFVIGFCPMHKDELHTFLLSDFRHAHMARFSNNGTSDTTDYGIVPEGLYPPHHMISWRNRLKQKWGFAWYNNCCREQVRKKRKTNNSAGYPQHLVSLFKFFIKKFWQLS